MGMLTPTATSVPADSFNSYAQLQSSSFPQIACDSSPFSNTGSVGTIFPNCPRPCDLYAPSDPILQSMPHLGYTHVPGSTDLLNQNPPLQPSSLDDLAQPLNNFTVRDCQIICLNKPKPYTFLMRGLQWTTVVERLFFVEHESERHEWLQAIQLVANRLRSESEGPTSICQVDLADDVVLDLPQR
ncbi:unnamed protein product [Schistocephalus solidus]|uniref:PH domain-containing protein n=1 Tax=Schistocephalus solidus TaxID=70667 RepID=A0A183TT78_SCHSO|nr:unnamed protein product [Schistocephalus solidus]